MDSILGTAWEELTPEVIAAFLAEHREESLTWEAKGTTLPNPGSLHGHLRGFCVP